MRKILLNSKFINIAIIANAFVVFFQEFSDSHLFLQYVDCFFTALFVAEVIIKSITYGIGYYTKSKLNLLDLFVIVISAISIVIMTFFDSEVVSFSFLTSLRVLRLFKSFRLLKVVPNMDQIVSGVNRAVKTSYVVVLSFLILLFIVSVFTCALFKDIAPEYFDNPLSSIYSVFRVFSVEGWYEIPDIIASRTSVVVAFFSKIYFVIILFVGGILGMSLINSIFVDAMVSDNNIELEKEVRNLSKKIEELTSVINNNKSN
ncbi:MULTISPECIES: ion transporter [unclassified Parabacteroides]|uniref:ion transporter n=1 Tax=unclassified Parabacteroides TaxID=2649774 RepID=UPI002473D073|nr:MULTISPECIES: ion transporter [unclassified Parabacteroides]